MLRRSRLLVLILHVVFTACVIARAQDNPNSSQVIREDAGGIFMEEVTPPPSQKRAPFGTPLPRKSPWLPTDQDFGNAGVKVDSTGKIIPLIQRQGAPVMPEGSQTFSEGSCAPWVPDAYVSPFGSWGIPYPWAGQFAYPGFPFALHTPLTPYHPGTPIPPIGPVGPTAPRGLVGPMGPTGPVGPIGPFAPYGYGWSW